MDINNNYNSEYYKIPNINKTEKSNKDIFVPNPSKKLF